MPTPQKQKQLYSSNQIRTGDALLVKSSAGWLSSLIRWVSHSSFVHTAIAVRIDRHLYVVECTYSNRYNYQLMPIDWWLARNVEDQVFIGRMPEQHHQSEARNQVKETVMSSTESLRPYKISWLVAVAFMQVWLGKSRPQFKHFFKKSKPLICSTLIQEAWERAGVIPKGDYMTPGDLVNMLGGESALTPFYEQRFSSHPVTLKASNDSAPLEQHFASA